ncbi:betaine/proline/choline family ABC transporter ATP-binding protein [Desulfosoma caldarium]|uniref:Osmoprotectant transport system ATP-binding protein n=1 Tax=Desulfosoma caldarium TaxID=610254 RepID=A0A3N1UW60_9BACT|nr:betaine/proline/choline family ABC transporter ATP-binding protein [Desulfosoma caldarium]ROQ92151.1 osmoprotectant transport system ATP-binding protein [Desulfosoma caldarium]
MIELQRVTKIYPGSNHPAVDGVTCTIPEGEICIFIGPSGCGKTTLMRMINRLVPITSGKILVGGKDIYTMDPVSLRRRIGYVIQEIGLFPNMTVRDNIAVVPKLLGWPKQKIDDRVDELLNLVNMPPDLFRFRYPRELSGGQAQRVGVARAMAADPPYMLMDEPFGAIDPINRAVLQDEFLKIQEKLKKTIIFVTHDIDEAIKMGDRICLLRDGRLEQYGTPDELLSNPKNDFVKNFVGTDRALKRLNLLKVEEAMLRDPIRCHVNDKTTDILRYMEREKLNYVIITDENDVLRGYVSRRDVADYQGPVEKVVRPMSLTVPPSCNLKDALSKMLQNDLGILCVVDEKKRLLGVLDPKTLFQTMDNTYDEKGGDEDRFATEDRWHERIG